MPDMNSDAFPRGRLQAINELLRVKYLAWSLAQEVLHNAGYSRRHGVSWREDLRASKTVPSVPLDTAAQFLPSPLEPQASCWKELYAS